MRTTLFILAVAAMVMPLSCRPVKKALKQGLVANDPLHIAILDFSKTSRLYSKDSAFHVTVYDTVWRLALKHDKGRDYKWVGDFRYDGIVAVDILGASDFKFLYTAKVKAGSTRQLPSRFIEENGKLFYWWDNNYPLTEEVITVFKKYHLLQDDQGGLLQVAQNMTDDEKKGVSYYFCAKDFSNYKKVTTNVALGYYDAPELNCK